MVQNQLETTCLEIKDQHSLYNHIHIFCFLRSFLGHSLIEYEYFLRSIWPIDGNLIGTTISGQSRPGSNGNEEILPTPQSWNLAFKYNLVSYPAQPFLEGNLTPLD